MNHYVQCEMEYNIAMMIIVYNHLHSVVIVFLFAYISHLYVL